MGQLKFDITGDNSAVLRAFKGVQDGVRQTAEVVEQQGRSIESIFNRIKSVASVAFAGFTAKEIVSTLATVRGDFQQFEIAFETMLGSAQKAKTMIADLANLAASTPFDMKGVVSGAKQLLAYGFEASEITETMRRLGDVTAGLGLNLQDLTWLYGTTMVQGRLFTRDLMQFTSRGIPMTEELGKQFGVTKDKVSELVSAGKIGFPEVKKAIESMTNEGGKFGGLMEKQSHSITGQISNIEDTIEMAINDLGTQTEGIMNDALDITSTVIDHWKEIGEVILAAASAIGLYKAMAVSVAAFDAATANVGYAAELSALDALLPAKEQAKKTDLEEAVAKGQLSAAQAELVASKREEAAAYVQELQVKAAAMKEEAAAAAQRVPLLENELANNGAEVERLQDAVDALETYTDAEVRETLETQLNTAANDQNIIAKRLKAARAEAAAAALAAETAQTEANAVAQNAESAATARGAAAKGIHAQITLLCEKAQRAWNNSMFASPLFWIAATIAAVTYTIYELATAESAHEEAVRKSNEAWDEFDNKVKERQQNIENLIRAIQSETATEYEKAEAYQKLSYLAPQLTEEYSQAQLASADFAKTQKEVAESIDDLKYDQAVAEVEKYRKKVEELYMTTQSVAGYTMGGTSNGRAYEQAQEDLEQAEEKLYQIIQLRDQAAENAKPIEIRLEEARENESVRQEIFDFYDEAITLVNDWQAANETINFVTCESRLDEFINKTETEIEGLRKDIEKKPADFKLQMKEEEKTKVLNHLLNMKDNWKATGATTIPLIFKADWQSAQQSLNQAKNKAQALANSGSTESYAKAYAKAQESYNAAKKKVATMEKNKSKYTAAEYETATQDLKAAKDAYSKLGGDVSGKSAKATETARKNRIKEEKQEVKLQEELNQKLKSLQQKNIDTEISLMKEGTEKKVAEIKNDYKKRLAEIDKQESEFKKKNKEAGKNGSLTKAQSDALKTSRDLAKQDYDKQMTGAYKEQVSVLNDYLKEYGTFKEKQLAIDLEYNKKIEEAEKNGYIFEAMTLRAQKQKEVGSNKASQLESQIDYTTVFGEFGIILKDQMQGMLNTMKDFAKTSEFKAKPVNEQKDFLQRMSQIEQKYGTAKWNDYNPAQVGRLIDTYTAKLKKRNEAETKLNQSSQKVIDANEEYQKVLAKGTAEQKKAAKQKVENAAAQNEQDRIALQDADAEVAQAQNNVADAATKLQNTLSSLDNVLGSMKSGSLKSVWDAFTDFDKKVNGGKVTEKVADSLGKVLGKAFEGKSDLVSLIIGAILNLLDTLKEQGIGGLVGGLIDSILGAIDGIVDNIATGEFLEQIVGAIVKGLGKLLTRIDIQSPIPGISYNTSLSSVLTNSNATKVNNRIEELTKSNERLDDSINRLKNTMEKSYGQQAKEAYEEAKRQQEQKNENLKEIAKQTASYHGAHNSWNHYWSGFNDDEIKKIQQAIGKSFNGDIWSLDENDMNIMLGYEWFTDKIRKTGKEYNGRSLYGENVLEALKKYAEAAGTIEELTDDFKESLTQVSFDSMKDSFVSSLMDMTKSAEDFSDDFAEMMQKALLSYSMEDLLNGDLKTLYDEWAKAIDDSKGQLTETQINEFNKRYDEIVEEGLKRRDDWSKITGYTGSTTQTATSGGWESMGQDTADELNGRFTALQIAGESIAQSMAETVSQMQSIVTLGISTNGAVLEIRNMMIMTNSYLEDVVKYAKLTYNDFGNKLDDMNARLKNI